MAIDSTIGAFQKQVMLFGMASDITASMKHHDYCGRVSEDTQRLCESGSDGKKTNPVYGKFLPNNYSIRT